MPSGMEATLDSSSHRMDPHCTLRTTAGSIMTIASTSRASTVGTTVAGG